MKIYKFYKIWISEEAFKKNFELSEFVAQYKYHYILIHRFFFPRLRISQLECKVKENVPF